MGMDDRGCEFSQPDEPKENMISMTIPNPRNVDLEFIICTMVAGDIYVYLVVSSFRPQN